MGKVCQNSFYKVNIRINDTKCFVLYYMADSHGNDTALPKKVAFLNSICRSQGSLRSVLVRFMIFLIRQLTVDPRLPF